MRLVSSLKIVILLFVFIGVSSFVNGQAKTKGYVELKGKTKYNKEPIVGATVKVYQGSYVVRSLVTNSLGKFNVKLDLDNIYIIEVSKHGLVTKRISIDTHVKDKEYIWPYPFTIELFEMVDGLDVSLLKQPVTKIRYFDKEGDFDYDEEYTRQMAAKINKVLAQLETLKASGYKKTIAEADALFKKGKYKEAIKKYDKAIDLDPYQDYPDNQIIICERKLREQQNAEGSYDRYIKSADSYLATKNYSNAKSFYNKALGVKPNEKYPKDKIAEIDKLLAQQKADEAEKQNQAEFNKYISLADKQFNNKDYSNAKSNYNKALGIKSGEQYPKDQISKIDKLLADAQAAAEKEKSYKEAIAAADKQFQSKDYAGAKANYNKALGIKSGEQYPKDQIAEIDKLLAAAEKEKNYKSAIRAGDKKMSIKDYIGAKKAYNKALTLKSDEQYPKDQITKINKLIEQEKIARQKQEKYDKLIAAADNLFGQKKYDSAKAKYKEAISVNSNSSYPKKKIIEIQNIQSGNIAANNKVSEEKELEFEKVNFQDKQAAARYLSDLARKYPPGKTVENYSTKNKSIKRIIINKNGVATEYKMVTHSWGGVYYFRNGLNVSKNIYYKETK